MPDTSPLEGSAPSTTRAPVSAQQPIGCCIHECFEQQAAKQPDAIALTFETASLTYHELNQCANQLAHYLRRHGVGPESLIALCMDRSIDMVVAVLAVLKAGGAYVPLDLVYPRERLKSIVDDAQCPILLTCSVHRDQLPEVSHATIIFLDESADAIARESADNPCSGVRPENAAYVIYTSGSTGKPKGAVIPHSNIVRLMTQTDAWYHFNETDVWSLFHSCAFDFSVWEIWGALCYGGRLLVVPYLVSRSPSAFYDLLHAEGVTVLNQTPSAFRQLMNYERSRAPEHRRPLALHYVIFGGEALDLAGLLPWFEYHGDVRPQLVNMYGITETTVHVTYRPLTIQDARENAGSLIGIPIPDLQLYVLDENLKPLPVGVEGELFVGGAGLARGYLNRPELTAQRFIPNPNDPNDRLYRTGDLVRRTEDGDLDYLGRIDQQVKLRGFRIELGEVESVIAQHPAVQEAAVVLQTTESKEQRLVAYLVCKGEVPDAELRKRLRERLPEYMVPAAFVRMAAFPLTPNGKLDRRALPEPDPTHRDTASPYVPPRNDIELGLAAIWQTLLGLERIGVHDNFFDLGGHSLLATQVVSRIRDALGLELPLRVLFESPTIEAIAKVLQTEACASIAVPPILPVSRGCPLPLSYPQESLWFLEEYAGGFGAYNVPVLVRFHGALDASHLHASLLRVIARHESLRTRFRSEGGLPVQIIDPDARLDWTEIGCSASEALAHAETEAARPFDLSSGPLIRATLYKLSPAEHLLCITIHHIVFDGWSVSILLKELAASYAGEPLDPLPLQFGDYAAWQRAWFQGEHLDRSLAYWKERLQGAPPSLELATDRPRPAAQTFRGEQACRRLSPELTDQLRSLSQRESVTLFVTLLSGWGALLHRYTGQDDLITGTGIAGRTRAELEGLIGFFVNTLALRLDLSGDPDFTTLLRRMQQVSLEAFEHQETPFEALVAALHPERGASRSPLFQVMFVFHNAPAPTIQFNGIEGRVEEIHNAGAKFDLTFAITDHPEGLHLALEYNADLFDASTVERLLAHYETLLSGACASPETRVSALPLLTESERRMLLEDWNATARPYPRESSLAALFTARAAATPDAIAVACAGANMTYRELNACSNRLARYLQRLGVGPETLVGLCANRSADMIVATLAIVKAGGAYVPLDPGYPAARLSYILEDTAAPVVLVQRDLQNRLPAGNARRIEIEDASACADYSEADFDTPATGDSLAYVMYTSGSTGTPKGVCIPHRAVARLVLGTDYLQLGPNDRVAQAANTAFDAATFEIWGPLLNGGCTVIMPRDVSLNARDLAAFLRSERITAMFLTTALFNQTAQQAPDAFNSLRCVMFGGEQCDPARVRAILQSGPPERLLHVYGPTETTTFATWRHVTEVPDDSRTIPIGRPLANTTAYILDATLQPVPVGVPGELYLGGDGLAREYLHSPEATAARFVQSPFGGRLYKTGDRVRYLPDGSIEFLGRTDFQVKIRGFRIELGEIESVLSRCDGVGETLVVVREDTPGDKRLIAYVVPGAGDALDIQSVRAQLRERLPDYMIPSAFVTLDAFPLNQNGKVDRRAFPAPEREAFTTATNAFIEPRTGVEQAIAEIWREILHLDRIGIHDNFFDLGGHSLLATQVVSRVRDRLQLHVPLRALFEAPTIAAFAAIVEDLLLDEMEDLSEEEAARRLAEGPNL